MRGMVVPVVALLVACGGRSAVPSPVERPAPAASQLAECSHGREEPARATGPRWIGDLDVVQLPAAGTDPVAPGDVVLVVAADGIYLDGERWVEASDGLLDLDAVDRGWEQTKELQRCARARLHAVHGDDQADGRVTTVVVPSVQLVLGSGARFELMIRAAKASAAAGAVMMELVGAGEGGARVWRLWLTPQSSPDEDVAVLAVTERWLQVFSWKGSLGTLTQPVVRTESTTAADLARVQAAIVAARSQLDTRDAILMADPTTPVQSVVDAIAALRVAPDGSELIGNVTLAGGFR